MASQFYAAGKFEHESSEGLVEYLTAVLGPSHAERAKTYVHSKPTIEVIDKGDHWVVHVTEEGHSFTNTVKWDIPFDETMPNGTVLKSVSTNHGNDRYTTMTELPDGNKIFRRYECNEAGIVTHYSDEKTGLKAVRVWRRV